MYLTHKLDLTHVTHRDCLKVDEVRVSGVLSLIKSRGRSEAEMLKQHI